MKILKEFKEFAVRGNVIDLAVGIIIGAAFGKIVSSIVNDIVMPVLGIIIGNINFSGLKLVIRPAEGEIPALTVTYGQFIQNVIDFLIIALAIFLIIKFINKLRTKKEITQPAKPPEPTREELLLTEIRDILKSK